MTIRGSCLCGSVRFEIDAPAGPFEICHCNRCRKVSGSIGMPTIGVLSKNYRFLSGDECITSYDAPLLYGEPAYRTMFCSKCGSPVPPPDPQEETLEIPAGLLDDDPGIKPDKHIFVEFLPAWDAITDQIPQYDIRELTRKRLGQDLPDGFKLRSHYDASR